MTLDTTDPTMKSFNPKPTTFLLLGFGSFAKKEMSITKQTFDVLHKNLSDLRPEYANRNTILCPICLTDIPESEMFCNSVEHIIPQNVIKDDEPRNLQLGTLNQRCGITILCRKKRTAKNDNRVLSNGCNGMKGSLYDRLFKNLFDEQRHERSELTHRHGVAILLMGYLGAFQYFGYDYILQPEFDEIREQFDFPDTRKTNWLDHAQYNHSETKTQIVTTSSGSPFIFGGLLTQDKPLQIFFRRCRVLLPKGHWQSKCVNPVQLLKP